MAVTTTYSSTVVKSEFTANGWTAGDQFGSEVVGLDNGGFVVVYGTDNVSTPLNDYPLLTFYNAAGNAIGSFDIPYDSNDPYLVGDPEIIKLSNGNVVVIWKEGPTATDHVVGSIFTPTGVRIAGEFTINSFSDADPEATALADGNFIVAMKSSSNNIYLQKVNGATGATIGGQIFTSVSADSDPAITGLNDGGWVVTYTVNDGTTGTNDSVYGIVYNSDGTVRKAEFEIGANFVGNDNDSSAVAALKNGGFAVVYKDTGWDGITLHIFNAAGTDLTGFIQVDTSAVQESDPDITVLDNGFIVVSWTHPYSGTDNDIYYRVYDQSGNLVTVDGLTGPFTLTGSLTDDRDASISTILSGVFVTTWTDSATDASGDGRITGEVNEISRTISSDGVGDTMIGDELRDTMFGFGGGDTLSGLNGNDYLDGGADNDSISGGNGSDALVGGTGADTLSGGGGDDYLYIDSYDISINGGTGYDAVFIQDTASFTFNVGAAGVEWVYGWTGNNVLNASASAVGVALVGEAGADQLIGSAFNDYIYMDAFDTLIDAGAGTNDALFVYQGFGQGVTNTTINVGATNAEWVLGGAGNDVIFNTGDSSSVTLSGGAGFDTITGGLANDYLYGNDGGDTFVVTSNAQFDSILDMANGVDRIDVRGLGAAFNTWAEVQAASSASGASTLINFGGGNILFLYNFAFGNLDATDFIF